MMNNAPFTLALVTGASSGIGEGLCYLLAKKGINLIVSGRNIPKLEALQALPVEVQVCPADLANPLERKNLVKLIHERSPDLVINNAGFGLYGCADELSTQEQLDMLEVNCAALLELSIEAAKSLRNEDKQGVILNVSSAAAYQTFPHFAVYAATKAFVSSFSEAFDYELRGCGIRCLASCPGMVNTRFRNVASKSEERKPPPMVMTTEFAVLEIWRQIQSGKSIHIFDWKFRFLTALSKLIPKRIRFPLLSRNIRNRNAVWL